MTVDDVFVVNFSNGSLQAHLISGKMHSEIA
jgi:hypothetical protein